MKQEKIKIIFLIALIGIVFSYLICVLFKLQVKNHDYFLAKREEQNKKFDGIGKRGTIYATRKDGEILPVAYDETWYKIIISPKDIPKSYEERLFTLLNKITPIERESFFKKMQNKKDVYEELALINKNQAQQVEDLNIFGLYTNKEYKRNYLEKEVMAKIIGFVGDGKDGLNGKYGLEKYYEQDLSGKQEYKNTFFSQIFANSDSQEINTKDIVTTLEPNVSTFLHNILIDMKNEWQADITAAIIIKTQTGEIVAMEATPSFDPNKFGESSISSFSNPSINGVYELGSIMKPITMASAINENLVTPETTFNDKGYVKVDEYTIKNFDEKVRGIVSMQEVISQSLNTGAVFVQQLLGAAKFKEYFNNFGLKENTDIDFPNEAINLTSNLDTNSKVNFATASFGQGVAVTPLSMIMALNIIVNGGKKVCPHFLKYKLYTDNTKAYFSCNLYEENVISKTTADTTKQMMIELIESGLAKGRYKDKNYFVGAKTGTAQLPSPDGKYYKDKFVHSYFTFFPGKNPEFSVLIYQVNPKHGTLASLTLAPYATKIKDFLLDYYNVVPDKN